jgi:hypothetical protein
MTKADQELHNRIDALQDALTKAKADLKRAIRVLDERIKKLALMKVSSNDLTTDDAMLSRKPLEGISCASCEKGLVNMSGMPVPYYNWKKMPVSHNDRTPMVSVCL